MLLVTYEVLVVYRSGYRHFKSLRNFLDFYTYFFGFLTMMILIPYDLLDETDPLANLFETSILMFTALRALTHLMVIDGVRHLVAMLIWVFDDMFYFLIVLISTLFVFGALNIHAIKTKDTFNLTFGDYTDSVNNVYQLAYANWEPDDTLNQNEYIVFLLGTVFLPLIMFNLLIAIISQTYERFTANRTVVNMRELVALLVDWNYFLTFYKKGWPWDESCTTFVQLIVSKQKTRGKKTNFHLIF